MKGSPLAKVTRPSANLPTRILGPWRSASMPTGRPLRAEASRTAVARATWSSGVPWEKFMRTTAAPRFASGQGFGRLAGQAADEAAGGFEGAFHVAAAVARGLAAAEIDPPVPVLQVEQGGAVMGRSGGDHPVPPAAGEGLAGPVLVVLFAPPGFMAEELHQLAAHQHRQAVPEIGRAH